MMAVVHNQNLFRALAGCLSCSSFSSETPLFDNLQPLSTRKRTSSFGGDIPSETPASKFMKVGHSPHISKRISVGSNNHHMKNNSNNKTSPEMNVRILAATILFVSFEELDHWPVPLVRAYAEDCFGSRYWVDEPKCQMLVQNLALTHKKGLDDAEDENGNHESLKANAHSVADFYRNFNINAPSSNGEKASLLLPSPSEQQVVRRGSHSSFASHSSSQLHPQRARALSSESFDKPKILVPKSFASTATAANSKKDEDSDSGDDEEVAITTELGKDSNANASNTNTSSNDDGDSSSGEEDEEEIVLAPSRSFDEFSPSSTKGSYQDPNALKLSYPVTQTHLKFQRIRQRYFLDNLESAHSAIAQSLHDRLDVRKSKQNSGLLNSLPNFTCIPRIRTLITANLEKWLQSPALAGLARNLFSQTVRMMKHVDPPLPADLEAIDNILAMRLKANQVRSVG